MRTRLLALMGVVLATLTGFATVAGAASAAPASKVAVVLDVSAATPQEVGNGLCTWTITTGATLINVSDAAVSVAGVGGHVSWQGPNDTSGVVNASVPASSIVGVSLAPGEHHSVAPVDVLATGIPCSATWADLALVVTDSTGGVGSGDHVFLDPGDGVPVIGWGALVGSGIAAVALVVRQQRKRRSGQVAPPAAPVGAA